MGVKVPCTTIIRTAIITLIVYINKAFSSDLRLANKYPYHIHPMVIIDMCHKERPYDNRPPLYSRRPYEILFPRNFQAMFISFIRTLVQEFSSNCVLPYSYHTLVLYTHFCASPQNWLFGITNSGYHRHSDSILAYSPQERLLSSPQDM